MKRNKKRFIRVATCIGISVVLLTTAVFANLDNASGYSTVKKGVKNLIYSENFTVDMEATIELNGETVLGGKNKMMYDKNGEASFSNETSSEDYEYSNYASYEKSTTQGEYRYYQYKAYDGTERKKAYKNTNYGTTSMFLNKTESFDKGVNFVESITDALIGDIKNNFILIDSSDENKTYSIDMTGEQLPSYVSAGISLMCSQVRQYGNTTEIDPSESASDIMENMFMNENEPFVDKITGNISFDDNDNLTKFDGNIIIKGYNYDGSEIALNFNLNSNVYDYGTTTIDTVNIEGYEDASREYQLNSGNQVTIVE